mgnify:CR=1 FL=1|jgi:hypothetical protein
MTIQTPGDAAHHHNPLVVQVRYLAASRPYIEPQANGEETVAQLKPRVLTFFGLAEGDVDGGRKQYAFSFDGTILTDLNVTLASLAGNKHRVDLTLVEQFVQG